MAIRTTPGTKPHRRGKKEAIAAGNRKINPREAVAQVHDLAWRGQHLQAVQLATQALAAAKISPPVQMDLLNLRSESHLAQGKLDMAADDAGKMVRLSKKNCCLRGRELLSTRRR